MVRSYGLASSSLAALVASWLLAAGCSTHAPGASSSTAPESVGTSVQAESADTFGIGTGRSGALSVTTAGVVVNTYAPVTASTSTTLTIGTQRGTPAFAPDDLVLVWRTTGLSATTANQVAFNLSTDVGHYEYARVKSVAGSVLTLTNPLGSATLYATGSQVIRVPEYTTVDVAAAGSIVADAWNGTSGGAVVFFATQAVTNAGLVDADAAGFRGGVTENFPAATLTCSNYDGSDTASTTASLCGGAHKGEGLDPTAYSASTGAPAKSYGYGNYANGAGGGDALRAGGGGGGHVGVGGPGGKTTVGATVGGLGGAPLVYDPTTPYVSMGGGGGAGDEQHGSATAGGAGGGLVLVRAQSIGGAAGTFSANGANAGSATTDGAGGGGAGGAVLLLATGSVVCGGATANGGNGGNGGSEPDGPGGGGGGGLVLLKGSATANCAPGVFSGTSGAIAGGSLYGAGPGNTGKIVTGFAFGFGVCTQAIVGANQCGGCVLDADCPAGQVCDTTKNTCNPCNATEQGGCSGKTSACAVSTTAPNTCVACNGDLGSAASAPCLSAATPKCVTTGLGAGTCGTCAQASDCATAAAPACSTATYTCALCNADLAAPAGTAFCGSAAAPYCQQAGTCGKCATNADCATAGSTHAGPTCDTTTGACGNTCSLDSDCGVGQWCDKLADAGAGLGLCQPRIANGQPLPNGAACTTTLGASACIAGACDPGDDLCGLANGTACPTVDGGGSECRSGVCPASGANAARCEPCVTDSDCSATGATPACSANNQCVACTATNATACTGNTPVCNTTTDTCAACDGDFGTKRPETCPSASAPFCLGGGSCGQCTNNNDCTGPVHGGLVCEPNGACSTACTVSAQCASSQFCSSGDPDAGATDAAGDAGAGSCTAKIADGTALPTSPASLATCTPAVALEVCASGVCDPKTNDCGPPHDAGAGGDGGSFDGGFANPGTSIEGGALSCDLHGGRVPADAPFAPVAVFGLALAGVALARRRS